MKRFSSIAKALGVEISLADAASGLVRVQNTEARKRALSASIDAVLAAKGATSREFETLRGRLLFAENQIFGRTANRALREVSHACRPSGLGICACHPIPGFCP